MGLLLILFILQLFFFFSIFDIYFRSPIVENVKQLENKLVTSTERLVLFVGDGLPADYLFDFSSGYSKAPFLRSVIEMKGTWGISHTRVPTESRPGHVAMIAGFYEDPSAVFKGWKENPVLFDSVFNQSKLTLSWGSPDIVPMFSKGPNTDHIQYFSYPSEMEDMSGINNSASKLDTWVVDNFKKFIQYNVTQYNILKLSKVIFFFHLLGSDVAGHANKPNSVEYEHTIKNMDTVVKEIYLLMENVFANNSTTYIFTSDHGMTAWGSHGAGTKVETETPVIAWGAGIKLPVKSDTNRNLFPANWQLSHLLSHNINQADISVLMSILLGISIPVHSIGILPVDFLNFTDLDKAEAFLLNARQLVAQFKAKEYQVKLHLADFFFRPYSDLTDISNNEEGLYNITKAINNSDFVSAVNLTRKVILSSLAGIDYYHTYFQNFLLTCTVFSFLGLTAIIIGEIMISYSSNQNNYMAFSLSIGSRIILNIFFIFFITSSFILCWADALPHRYIVYLLTPLCLWYWAFIKYPWILKCSMFFKKSVLIQLLFYFIGIKLLVLSFYHRGVLSLALLGLCTWPTVDGDLQFAPRRYKIFWSLTCIILSIFPLLPIVGGEEQLFFKIVAGFGWLILHFSLFTTSTFRSLGLKCNLVNKIQLFFTPLLLWNIFEISDSFKKGKGLHIINQCFSYALLVLFLVLMPFGPNRILPRFITLSYSMGLTFLMFSASYEALFPLILASNLLCWILFERLINLKFTKWPACILIYEARTLSSHDFRRSFFYVFYIILSFFGIGNLASLNSFDMVWVRSFITLFSPFTMMTLLLLKVILPFILVTSAFRFVGLITQANSKTLFLIVLLICDFMAMQFLFSIQNKGSWLDIGTSVSHFVIMKTIVIFLLILFQLTKYITTLNRSSNDCDTLLEKWHDA